MRTSHSLLLTLTAGIAGVAIGRALPHDPPRTTASAPAPSVARPDRGCERERAELYSTRAQLSICMAYRPTDPAPDLSGEPAPAASTSVSPYAHLIVPDPTGRLAEVVAEMNRPKRYIEVLYVRRTDGTVKVYGLDEWAPDGGEGGQVVARRRPDGRNYAPDAGPDAAPMTLEDIAPEGVLHFSNGNKFTFGVQRRDAGAP